MLLCTTGPQVYRDAIIFLPDGLLLTFKVTAYSICGAVPLGLLTGLGRISRNRFFNLLASTYVEVIRGIPCWCRCFYIYFAISMLVKMEGVTSAVIALSFCYGAYMGEVFRAGILAIPHGQTEAARSLGFNRVQTMFYVVLPQAWRTIIPPVGNECIAMLKDTALVSVIGMPDLMQRAPAVLPQELLLFRSPTPWSPWCTSSSPSSSPRSSASSKRGSTTMTEKNSTSPSSASAMSGSTSGSSRPCRM